MTPSERPIDQQTKALIASANPDQIVRLLRDIQRSGTKSHDIKHSPESSV